MLSFCPLLPEPCHRDANGRSAAGSNFSRYRWPDNPCLLFDYGRPRRQRSSRRLRRFSPCAWRGLQRRATPVLEMLAGLRQWQAFLTVAREGLSVEAQRGLFGELLFLGRVLVPALGARAAVQGWKGAARAQQDFQFPRGAVEVKTTSAVVPESVQITSERQLDDRGAGALFLHVIIVDDREVAPAPGAPGETLADIVSLTRSLVDGDASARVALDEGLLCAGWLDANAARYDARRLTVRSQLSFHVREGFPTRRGRPSARRWKRPLRD